MPEKHPDTELALQSRAMGGTKRLTTGQCRFFPTPPHTQLGGREKILAEGNKKETPANATD